MESENAYLAWKKKNLQKMQLTHTGRHGANNIWTQNRAEVQRLRDAAVNGTLSYNMNALRTGYGTCASLDSNDVVAVIDIDNPVVLKEKPGWFLYLLENAPHYHSRTKRLYHFLVRVPFPSKSLPKPKYDLHKTELLVGLWAFSWAEDEMFGADRDLLVLSNSDAALSIPVYKKYLQETGQLVGDKEEEVKALTAQEPVPETAAPTQSKKQPTTRKLKGKTQLKGKPDPLMLIPLLSNTRAQDRQAWLNVCIALKHHAEEIESEDYAKKAQDAWVKFSKRGGEDFVSEEDAIQTWDSVNPRGELTVASLIYWAKNDSPANFQATLGAISRHSYESLKEELEKTFFYSANQTAYVEVLKISGKAIVRSRVETKYHLTTQHFLKWNYQTSKFTKAKFFDQWEADETKRSFRTFGTYFGKEELAKEDEALDLFCGWAVDRKHPTIPECEEKTATHLEAILDLIRRIAGGTDEGFEYLVRWIYHAIRFPTWKKNQVAVVTYSEHHRQGRTSFAEWLKDDIFGKEYVEISDDPERLFGKHAEGRVGKILCSFNEASLATTASYEERLKAFITDVSDTVNAKGIRAREVSNFCRWLFQTNNPVAVKIGSEDVRYWPVAYDSPGPAGSEGWKNFWKKLGPALDDTQITPRALMNYLHGRFGPGAPNELPEKFNFQTHRPTSRLLEAARVRCRESHLEFLLHPCNNNSLPEIDGQFHFSIHETGVFGTNAPHFGKHLKHGSRTKKYPVEGHQGVSEQAKR